MHTWIEIEAQALNHNYAAFRNLGSQDSIVPVIKSNAYGHGIQEVYQILSKHKPKWICVNYVEEAQLLRDKEYRGRILVVGPILPEELHQVATLNLDIVVGHWDLLKEIASQKKRTTQFNIHIKFDTGMARQGFACAMASQIISELQSWTPDNQLPPSIRGICSHFANVEDVTEHEYAELQLSRFKEVGAKFGAAGFSGAHHIASSASTLLMTQARLDLQRVGISLYGVWPSKATQLSYLQIRSQQPELSDIVLKPALTWKTRIAQLREISAGSYVGYGCTHRVNTQTTLAVLPVGYNEGYPRIAGDHSSYVLVRGSRCHVIGRVCMNMMMIDVTHLHGVQPYEEVTLIGLDEDESISAEALAGFAQTIHYELLTRLHPDIPRRIVQHG